MAALRSRLTLVGAALAAGMSVAPITSSQAADPDLSRRIVLMIYDIGLYDAELDRVMAQADSRGVYAGNSAASRARNRTTTRALMVGQRDAVLSAAAVTVAARATDPELNALLQAASSNGAVPDTPLMDEAVTVVKSSFEDALWNQLARTARGAAEFPCTREQRSRCS